MKFEQFVKLTTEKRQEYTFLKEKNDSIFNLILSLTIFICLVYVIEQIRGTSRFGFATMLVLMCAVTILYYLLYKQERRLREWKKENKLA